MNKKVLYIDHDIFIAEMLLKFQICVNVIIFCHQNLFKVYACLSIMYSTRVGFSCINKCQMMLKLLASTPAYFDAASVLKK